VVQQGTLKIYICVANCTSEAYFLLLLAASQAFRAATKMGTKGLSNPFEASAPSFFMSTTPAALT
jgi:hypothetical protein